MPKLLLTEIEFNERYCYSRLRENLNNIQLINLYALTEFNDDKDKEIFYTQIAEIVSHIAENNTLIMLGIANAKIVFNTY